jgi:hypothetical protein
VPPRFYTLSDVAEILNVTPVQARALVTSGELLGIQVGGRNPWRVEAIELEAYIQRKYEESRFRIEARRKASRLAQSTRTSGLIDRLRARRQRRSARDARRRLALIRSAMMVSTVPLSVRIFFVSPLHGMRKGMIAEESWGGCVSEVRVPAVRLKAPSWRDGRLIVGILIVLSSVILGARVVAAAGRTVPVFAAVTDLPSGRQLTREDLRVVSVHLGTGVAPYLTARREVPPGSVLTRAVGAGELLPSGVVGPASAITRRPLAIPVQAPGPDGLRPGAGVDVWSSAKETGTGAPGYAPPVRIAQGAEVYAATKGGDSLGSAGASSVQVLLDEGQLRSVLDAVANGAKIVLVPVLNPAETGTGSGGREGAG